jgi:hypothetical protein
MQYIDDLNENAGWTVPSCSTIHNRKLSCEDMSRWIWQPQVEMIYSRLRNLQPFAELRAWPVFIYFWQVFTRTAIAGRIRRNANKAWHSKTCCSSPLGPSQCAVIARYGCKPLLLQMSAVKLIFPIAALHYYEWYSMC